MSISIDLFAECTGSPRSKDRSAPLAPTTRYYQVNNLQLAHLEETGDHHLYIVASGVIDSTNCFLEAKLRGLHVVPNGLKFLFQVGKKTFLLSAASGEEVMEFTICQIGNNGEPQGESCTSPSFGICWKKVVKVKSRASYLKLAKLQRAIQRQVEAFLKSNGQPAPWMKDLLNEFLKKSFEDKAKVGDKAKDAAPTTTTTTPTTAAPTLLNAKRSKTPLDLIKTQVLDFEYEYGTWHLDKEKMTDLRNLVATAKENGMVWSDEVYPTVNLALCVFQGAEWDEAITLLQRAKAIVKNKELEMIITRWIGRSLQKQGKIDEAEHELNKVLEYFGNDGQLDKHHLAVAYSDLAWIYHDRVNSDPTYANKAIVNFTMATNLRQFEPHVYQHILLEDMYGLGCMIVLDPEQCEQAIWFFETCCKRGESYLKNGEFPMLWSRLFRGLAIANARKKDEFNALKWINKAIEQRELGGGKDHPQVANLNLLASEICTTDANRKAKYKAEAQRIWDLNNVAEDHPWRTLPPVHISPQVMQDTIGSLEEYLLDDLEEHPLDDLLADSLEDMELSFSEDRGSITPLY
ncbi:hypothetical protein BASA81_003186 [Batrachochytrium salamandrivorans]|nr:hypothetical protein BASA81_003186 [Batrachochytrium salamandrivorans]